jgi:hypothetical protein
MSPHQRVDEDVGVLKAVFQHLGVRKLLKGGDGWRCKADESQNRKRAETCCCKPMYCHTPALEMSEFSCTRRPMRVAGTLASTRHE